MTTTFPSSVDNFTNPTADDRLDTPTVLHSDQHANANDAIEALETWALGTGAPVTIGAASGLSIVGQVLSLGIASSGVTGALSGTDWDTFNGKQDALGFTPVNAASVDWLDLTDGGETALHTHAGGVSYPLTPDLGGTGIANAAGSTLTLGAALSVTGGGTIALGGFTLTVPATGTAALLATANVFTAIQKINVNSATALLVEQDGVKDNTLVVDTAVGAVMVNTNASTYADGNVPETAQAVAMFGSTVLNATDKFQAIDMGTTSQSWNFIQNNSSGRRVRFAALNGQMSGAAGAEQGVFKFYTKPSTGAVAERMRISSLGLVGIGTTGATARLEVVGITDIVQMRVKANATQTTNLQTWETSAGVVVAAVSGIGNLTIGGGAAATDYSLTFNGETNDGILTWMEDEDYFQFEDDVYPYQRLLLPMGEVNYFSTTGTAVVIAAQSDGSTNMVVVAPATTLANDMEFDNGGADNGRLRYIGATTKSFHVACTISFAPATANDTFVIGIAKSGTVLATSKVLTKVTTGGDIKSTAMHVMVSLATNDYLEVYFGNTTDADDFTVYSLTLFAMGM